MKKITAIILCILTLLGVGNLAIGIVNNRLINKVIEEEAFVPEITTQEPKVSSEETTQISTTEPVIEEKTTESILEELSTLPVLEQTDYGKLVYDSEKGIYYLISERENVPVDTFLSKGSSDEMDYLVKEDYIFFTKEEKLYVWCMCWNFTTDVYSKEYFDGWPISDKLMEEIIINTQS